MVPGEREICEKWSGKVLEEGLSNCKGVQNLIFTSDS